MRVVTLVYDRSMADATLDGTARPVGAVLAGGAGRRMGGAKPGAPLAGRPLIAWPLDALKGAGLGEIVVVAKASTALPSLAGIAVRREPDEPRHPLAGVVEALRWAAGRPVVVLACDLPLVDAGLVGLLASADSLGTPAVVARADGRIQPLCARYEPRALELLAGFDASGRAVPQVEALGPVLLDVDGSLLRNVNTPQDLASVAELLGDGARVPGR